MKINTMRCTVAGLLIPGLTLLSPIAAGSSFNAEATATLTLIEAIADDSGVLDFSDLIFDFAPEDEQVSYEMGNAAAIAKSSPTLTFSGGFLNPTILIDVTAASSGGASASDDPATAESQASSLFQVFVENNSLSTGYTISGALDIDLLAETNIDETNIETASAAAQITLESFESGSLMPAFYDLLVSTDSGSPSTDYVSEKGLAFSFHIGPDSSDILTFEAYTDALADSVSAVPLPPALYLSLSALALMGGVTKRKKH